MPKTALCGSVINGKQSINKQYYDHITQCGADIIDTYPFSPIKAVKECDCLIVCGGGDMHPKFYNQEPIVSSTVYDIYFDEYELSLIGEFVKAGKPILGICRGMQSINVAMGGTLIQDIPYQLGLSHSDCGNRVCMHEIKIAKNSRLVKSMGIRAIVNSHHHQCVHILGSGMYVAAASHDGVVEAIESENLPILCVQWHPERMSGNTVFEHFFETYL